MENMNKLKKLEIFGSIFVIITGSISHFVYDWFGQKKWLSLFFPTNESTFEHLKLLLYPFILYAIFEYWILQKDSEKEIADKLACAKTISLIAGLLSIVMLFYTYTGVFGKSILFIDIAIFIFSVLLSFYISYYILTNDSCRLCNINPQICLFVLFILVAFFLIFSINPPDIPFFHSPSE